VHMPYAPGASKRICHKRLVPDSRVSLSPYVICSNIILAYMSYALRSLRAHAGMRLRHLSTNGIWAYIYKFVHNSASD